MLIEKLKNEKQLTPEGFEEMATEIGGDQSVFNQVFELLYDEIPSVRTRAAELLVKVSSSHPELMEERKRELFKQLPRMQTPDVKIRMARLLPHLQYDMREQKFVADLLLHWLKAEVRSEDVKIECMEALAIMAMSDPFLRPEVLIEIEQQMFNGSIEIRNRGQKLLQKVRSN